MGLVLLILLLLLPPGRGVAGVAVQPALGLFPKWWTWIAGVALARSVADGPHLTVVLGQRRRWRVALRSAIAYPG